MLFKNNKLAWFFLLPSLLLLLLFSYYPAIYSFVLSFYRINLTFGTQKFIGLDYYYQLLGGENRQAYLQVLIQTFLYAFTSGMLSIALAFTIAYHASKTLKGNRFFRLFLLWPFAIPSSVAGAIFLFNFNPDAGFVNKIFESLFAVSPQWFSQPLLVWIVLISVTVWKSVSFNILFYLAAMQSLDDNAIGAAYVDGATSWQCIRKIIWPMLAPTTVFLLFSSFSYALFDSFGLIDVMTKGGPSLSGYSEGITTTLMYKIYKDGFSGFGALGLASAQSVLLILMSMIWFAVQFRNFFSRAEGESSQ